MRIRTKNWPLSLYILIVWPAISCFLLPEFADASALKVGVHDTKIDIQAEKIPLIKVLQAISVRVGFSVEANVELDETITLEATGISLESCLARLMRSRSYFVLYAKSDGGIVVPEKLKIIEPGGTKGFEYSPPEKPANHNIEKTDYSSKRVKKSEFALKLGNSKKLLSQIFAKKRDVPKSHEKGVRIARVLKDTWLHDMGMRDGDLIENVNGKPVKTLNGLITTLRSVYQSKNQIRIERFNSQHKLAPIYIEIY